MITLLVVVAVLVVGGFVGWHFFSKNSPQTSAKVVSEVESAVTAVTNDVKPVVNTVATDVVNSTNKS